MVSEPAPAFVPGCYKDERRVSGKGHAVPRQASAWLTVESSRHSCFGGLFAIVFLAIQTPPNLQQFDFKVFNFTMVWKWYTLSRNHTWNFEFQYFPKASDRWSDPPP